MQVLVVDHQGQFSESVAPAVARHALKTGAATISQKDPFTIQLEPGVDVCPRPDSSVLRRSARQPEVIRGVVRRRKHTVNQYTNPAQAMFDIGEFFEQVDRKNGGNGIVWAKATAPRGRQVIIELENSMGKRVKVPPIKAGDPVCLSKFAKFEVLRDSTDLAQGANNGLLKLMTHEEALAWFEQKAAQLKTSSQELMNQAEQASRASTFRKPLEVSQVDRTQKLSDMHVAIEDVVNPRLEDLCAKVQPMLKDAGDERFPEHQRRIPVNEMMAEVYDLQDSLTMEDLAYLQANGYYPTVKKWAEAQQRELAQKMGLMPTSDALSEEPQPL